MSRNIEGQMFVEGCIFKGIELCGNSVKEAACFEAGSFSWYDENPGASFPGLKGFVALSKLAVTPILSERE